MRGVATSVRNVDNVFSYALIQASNRRHENCSMHDDNGCDSEKEKSQ